MAIFGFDLQSPACFSRFKRWVWICDILSPIFMWCLLSNINLVVESSLTGVVLSFESHYWICLEIFRFYDALNVVCIKGFSRCSFCSFVIDFIPFLPITFIRVLYVLCFALWDWSFVWEILLVNVACWKLMSVVRVQWWFELFSSPSGSSVCHVNFTTPSRAARARLNQFRGKWMIEFIRSPCQWNKVATSLNNSIVAFPSPKYSRCIILWIMPNFHFLEPQFEINCWSWYDIDPMEQCYNTNTGLVDLAMLFLGVKLEGDGEVDDENVALIMFLTWTNNWHFALSIASSIRCDMVTLRAETFVIKHKRRLSVKHALYPY